MAKNHPPVDTFPIQGANVGFPVSAHPTESARIIAARLDWRTDLRDRVLDADDRFIADTLDTVTDALLRSGWIMPTGRIDWTKISTTTEAAERLRHVLQDKGPHVDRR